MKIAVVGSYKPKKKDFKLRSTQGLFAEACQAVGRVLAEAQQLTLLGSERKNTADYYVELGIFRAVGSDVLKTPIIKVIRPSDDYVPYAEHQRSNPSVFEYRTRPAPSWKQTHLFAISEADAVLTIGGGDGTYLAGLATIVARKSLISIGCFGGASEQLLGSLKELQLGPYLEAGSQLNAPWSEASVNICRKLVGCERPVRLLLIHGHSDDWKVLKKWLVGRKGQNVDVTVMKEAFGGGKTLPEKFESLAIGVDGAIAVVTPDDIGRAQGAASEERARENVWLEVGWFWGHTGRNRVLLLRKGGPTVPSDLRDVEYYSYNESPLEQEPRISEFLGTMCSGG